MLLIKCTIKEEIKYVHQTIRDRENNEDDNLREEHFNESCDT